MEEDVFSDYSQLLLKYFCAEGIACRQQLYVAIASSDQDASVKWIRQLPYISGAPGAQSTSKSSSSSDIESNAGLGDDIKIAFQYKKYMGAETMQSSKPVAWCHSYDHNKHMEPSYINACDIKSRTISTAQTTTNPYRDIYDELNALIYQNNEPLAQGGAATISRICLPSLASVFYASHAASNGDTEHKKSVVSFLRALRGLLRQSFATCMVSFPAHLYADDPTFLRRLQHTADAVVRFSAFTGTLTFQVPLFLKKMLLAPITNIPFLMDLSKIRVIR